MSTPKDNDDEESNLSGADAITQLLCQLTDSELINLYRWVRARLCPNLPELFDTRKIKNCLTHEVGAASLYSFVYYILFGKHVFRYLLKKNSPMRRSVYKRVLDSILALKEKLSAGMPVECLNKEEVLNPAEKIVAWNKCTGDVVISAHALQRFIERGGFQKEAPERLVCALQRLFKNAVPVELSPAEQIARLINNDFKPARYFLHRGSNFRFVIPEQKTGETPIVVTIERPC